MSKLTLLRRRDFVKSAAGAGTALGLVNAACGLDLSLAELLRCGERAWNLKRLINHRLGLNRTNDRLPLPLLRPYIDSQIVSAAAGSHGEYVPPFEEMLAAYYAARGWDPTSGFPLREKLAELGLEWVDL